MRRNSSVDPFEISGSSKLKSYSVNDTHQGKWFEIDALSKKKGSAKNDALGLLLNQDIIKIWFGVLLVGILILFVRVSYLQIVQGEHFSAIAEGNRLRVLDIKAVRGVIFDRNNNLLVENVPSFSLAIVPVDLEKDEIVRRKVAAELSQLSNQTAEVIYELISNQSIYSYQPVIIKENLNHDEAILAEILASKHPGVILKVDNIRQYLITDQTPSLSHVLGYTGKIEEEDLAEYLEKNYSIDDYVGKTGIEIIYETVLKGINGKQLIEVDATGEAKENIVEEKPIAGQNLILTIDTELQIVAENALRRVMGVYGKRRGVVIILDPNNGEILALVSLPTFDNNLFSQGITQEDFTALIEDENRPFFNRAVSGEYPSGSTFKLVVGAAALEEGIITSNTGFNSVGGIAVDRWFFPDWKAGGHGWTNIIKAISESVNTFFYTIGGGYEDFTGLGVERIKQYAQNFGLGRQLGIDLPNEADGFLPSIAWKEEYKQERWYIGDTYNLSIGQGDVLVTPLQVASWTSVFANGGTLYQPHLVKGFLDTENNIVKTVEPIILNEGFISADNIAVINKGLRQAVLSGSAISLYELPITVAAKTGTAQWSSTKPPHGWVTTFAPYKNPQIVVTVLVEEGIGGTTTGTPVAKEILNWWGLNRAN